MLLRRTPPVDPRAAARVAVLLQGPGGWVPPEPQRSLDGRSRGRHAQRAEPHPRREPHPSWEAAPDVAGQELSPEPYAVRGAVAHDVEPALVGRQPHPSWDAAARGVEDVDSGPRPDAAAYDLEDPDPGPEPYAARAAAAYDVEDPDPGPEPYAARAAAGHDVEDPDPGRRSDLESDTWGASPLDRWRAGRLDPGRRGVAALALVAVLAAVLAGVVVLRGRPQPVAPPPVVAAGVPVPGADAAASGPGAAEVVVSVGGAVRRPGLVRLPAGSRVDDAVQAAGGPRKKADLGLLNLARRLVDGEQVLVGVPAPEAAPGPAAAGDPGGGLVDLNTATLAQLDALSGIGPVLAQRILDWRTENGRFASVDQLREVSGIGESTFAELKAEVTV